MKRVLYSIASVVVLSLVVIHVFLYFMQERMIFFPQPPDPEVVAAVRKAVPGVEEVMLKGAEGTLLQGWFVPGRGATLIYFGGNAEEVSGFGLDSSELPGLALAYFNYRGYGRSQGTPGEAALYADALAIYDHVAARPGVDPKRIILMGRSLGSGVATYLATQRRVEALILVTPYDSVAALARSRYPFVLVDPLLRHRFDSMSRAANIAAPALIIAGADDRAIPPAHAAALARAWRGPVKSVVLPGAGHNDISMHDGYWRAVRAFLPATPSASGRGAPGH